MLRVRVMCDVSHRQWQPFPYKRFIFYCRSIILFSHWVKIIYFFSFYY